MLTSANKFIFTENKFLLRLIKKESHSSLPSFFLSVFAVNMHNIKTQWRGAKALITQLI